MCKCQIEVDFSCQGYLWHFLQHCPLVLTHSFQFILWQSLEIHTLLRVWTEDGKNKMFCLTLWSRAASSMGQKSCCLCFFDVWQTTHTGSLSSWQKSLKLSPCRLQSPFGGPTLFPFRTASHRFFNARFRGSSPLDDFRLHTGHSRDFLTSQHVCRQPLQMLWLHSCMTGSLKISQQTGQVRSSSGKERLEAISAGAASVAYYSLCCLSSLKRDLIYFHFKSDWFGD